uniref:ribosomal protein L22 n=1 Tax=Corydalis pseudoimpatiens TaxID=2973998 RepID=UPI0021823E01|nr:ribosomal protein L22 [Corydalis pseudoimpatiens]UVH68011.1 ribosomal protein L22 [Corydalis pseudoimpatiens]
MIKKNKVGEGEVYICGHHIRLSANKARRVIDQIRGRSYEEALRILGLMPYRACEPILKLVSSAAANANHNRKIKKTDLIISKAEVNRGTIRKKLKPRARGHSYPIKKTTCRITIVLKDVSLQQKKDSLWQKLLRVIVLVMPIVLIGLIIQEWSKSLKLKNRSKDYISIKKDG